MKKSLFLRKVFLMLLDAFFILVSTTFAAYAVYGTEGTVSFLKRSVFVIGAVLVAKLIILMFFRFYNFLWQYAGVDEAMMLSLGMVVTFVLEALTIKFLQINYGLVYPLRISIITFVFSTIFIMFVRISYRMLSRISTSYNSRVKVNGKTRVMIVGAGGTGLREAGL